MASAPVAPSRTWNGTLDDLSSVPARFRSLRVEPDGRPIASASVLNLVGIVADEDSADEVGDVIAAMSRHQPSRAVVVETRDGHGVIDVALESRVQGFPGGPCVQVEQAQLTVHTRDPDAVASAVIPLLRADLPTFLWWPGVPSRGNTLFERLARSADRVISEVAREPNASQAFEDLQWIVDKGEVAVTDLAWARITTWRQLVVQLVDAQHAERMRHGSTVQLSHPGPTPTAEALLLAGWLRDALGPKMAVQFDARPNVDAGEVIGLRLEATGGTKTLQVERDPAYPVAMVQVSGLGQRERRRVLSLPIASRPDLLAGELELMTRDHAFENALPHAQKLAS